MRGRADAQYLSSRSFITVDWGRLAGRYDSAFGTPKAEGGSKSPTVAAAWQWIVDFVTANFQRELHLLANGADAEIQNEPASSPVWCLASASDSVGQHAQNISCNALLFCNGGLYACFCSYSMTIAHPSTTPTPGFLMVNRLAVPSFLPPAAAPSSQVKLNSAPAALTLFGLDFMPSTTMRSILT